MGHIYKRKRCFRNLQYTLPQTACLLIFALWTRTGGRHGKDKNYDGFGKIVIWRINFMGNFIRREVTWNTCLPLLCKEILKIYFFFPVKRDIKTQYGRWRAKMSESATHLISCGWIHTINNREWRLFCCNNKRDWRVRCRQLIMRTMSYLRS